MAKFTSQQPRSERSAAAMDDFTTRDKKPPTRPKWRLGYVRDETEPMTPAQEQEFADWLAAGREDGTIDQIDNDPRTRHLPRWGVKR